MAKETTESTKLYPQVRLLPETRETLEDIKRITGWKGTEAMKRIVADYARRKRIRPSRVAQ